MAPAASQVAWRGDRVKLKVQIVRFAPKRPYPIKGFRPKLDHPRSHPWLRRAPDGAGREL
eukprot:6939816-Prymnesium_polylepis.1